MLDINPQTKKSIRVETTKLDDFLKNQGIDFQKIKMVKIDIEGYEPFALKGATELLAKSRRSEWNRFLKRGVARKGAFELSSL